MSDRAFDPLGAWMVEQDRLLREYLERSHRNFEALTDILEGEHDRLASLEERVARLEALWGQAP